MGQFRSLTEDELHYKHGIKNASARAKFMAVLSRTARKPRDHAMRSSVGSMTPMSPIGPPANPGELILLIYVKGLRALGLSDVSEKKGKC